jgi:hypothetical protein
MIFVNGKGVVMKRRDIGEVDRQERGGSFIRLLDMNTSGRKEALMDSVGLGQKLQK